MLGLVLALTWTLSPADLATAKAGSVTILDARGSAEYRAGHVPGAIRVDWKAFRDGWGRTGKLSPDLDRLASDLTNLGVDSHRRVVVYGAARDGWGEEGRIAWMLAYLGHPDVRVLDGGWNAWVASGAPVSVRLEKPLGGAFRANPNAALRATAEDVLAADAQIVDVRSTAEWNGATLHFERRGGHIPGAVHVEWLSLLALDGRFDVSDEARARLAAAGLDPGRPVIVYCTAGVRSAHALLALQLLGYADVRNYDGSWYEWSADRSRPAVTNGAMP